MNRRLSEINSINIHFYAMAASLKLFIFLAVLVTVNCLNPIEKLQNLKEKSVAAIGQVKHTISAYKAQTQAKIQNMKSYLNYLKNVVYAKTFPYFKKPALTHEYGGYDYKIPVYTAAVKPILSQVYPGYDHKFPRYYYHDQPYSYVQFQSGPGYYKSGILH